MSLSYVHEPERWTRLAARLREAGAFGLDTEYYTLDGSDTSEMTTWGRVRIHVWSLCFELDGEYHTAVLPVAALECPELRAVLEDPTVLKYLHNAPVDVHAFGNHGVTLGGPVDTLLWARSRMPERHFAGGYGLKDLARDKLQEDTPVEFWSSKEPSLTGRPTRKVKVKYRKWKSCSCGAEKCKKRTAQAKPGKKPTKKDPTPHEKTERLEAVLEVSLLKKRLVTPLQDITVERARALVHCCQDTPWPDFTERTGLVCWPCLWDALVEYAGKDALWALRLVLEVFSKEGHAYGHAEPTPDKLQPRPTRR